MHSETGRTITLARTEGLGHISMCPCGVTSLHLGCVTVRLESTALLQVEGMIQEALETMREIVAQQQQMGAGAQHVH